MAGYRRLPSGLHQATVRTPDGRRLTRTDPLKGVVRAWAEDTETAIRRGEWVDPRSGRLTLGQWWERWDRARVVEEATSARDHSHWRNHIEPRWGATSLTSITSWDVEGWSAQMHRDGMSATTRRHVLGLFRQLCREAVRHRLLATDPTTGLKLPRPSRHVDRVLSHAEWSQLWDAGDELDRAQTGLMALCGLRWGEMAGLDGARVNPMRRVLSVEQVRRANGRVKPYPKSHAGTRVVPVPDDLLAVLSPRLTTRGALWTPSYSNWSRDRYRPLLVRAGLDDPQPTPHDLRHSYGTWLADAGVPPHEIMSLMGHASLTATQRYLHAGVDRLDRARGALPRTADRPAG